MTHSRVLFVGLDSAEPELLIKWSEEGLLPTLHELLPKSFWGRLQVPPGLSHAATWASLYTGVNPGKHGCAYGTRVNRSSYRQTPFEIDTDLKHEPIWSVLSRANRRVLVIDVPKAPLTPGINGFQLADWTTHGTNPDMRSWPPELAAEVMSRFGGDPLGKTSDADARGAAGYKQLRDVLIERIALKTRLTTHYLNQEKWDFCVTVFSDAHDVGHQCWHLYDPKHPLYDHEWRQRFGDPVQDIYIALDAAVGEVVRWASEDTTIVFFAGPGMQALYTGNHLLDAILGRLETGPGSRHASSIGMVKSIYRRLVPSAIRMHLGAVCDLDAMFDWRHRSCFPVSSNTDNGAIRVNLVGREPNGVINPGPQYEMFCDRLTQDLLALSNVDTGERVVNEVIRTDRLYYGEHVGELAPDVLVVWNRSAPIRIITSPRVGVLRSTFQGTRTGDHTNNALFLIHGPGIEPVRLRSELPVEAITPTIGWLLGVNVEDADSSRIVLNGNSERAV